MEEVDLSQYCPKARSQYRATCYAYAVAYTAFSTEYNIQNNITDINRVNQYNFSAGVVASIHNSSLPLFKKSPYCGKYGTANKSLEILKNTGTIFSDEFDCDCNSFTQIKSAISNKTKWYKINDFETLEVNNTYSNESLGWIISALKEKHPVIIGLYQNAIFRNINSDYILAEVVDEKTTKLIQKNSKGISNHVVCILGFNSTYLDGKGFFLVKNNYLNWGRNGFSWIPYTYLLPLIHEAYYIKGIKIDH